MDMYRLRDGNLNDPCNTGTINHINVHFTTLTQQLRNVQLLCESLIGTNGNAQEIDTRCYEDTLYHNFENIVNRERAQHTSGIEEFDTINIKDMFIGAVIMKLRKEQFTNEFVTELIRLKFAKHDHTRKPELRFHTDKYNNKDGVNVYILKTKKQFEIPKKYFTFNEQTLGTDSETLLQTIKHQKMLYEIINYDDIESFEWQKVPGNYFNKDQPWLFPQDLTGFVTFFFSLKITGIKYDIIDAEKQFIVQQMIFHAKERYDDNITNKPDFVYDHATVQDGKMAQIIFNKKERFLKN